MLFRAGIEINDGSLANALNVLLFPVLKQGSHVIFLQSAGFCINKGQGHSQRGGAGTNAPAPAGLSQRTPCPPMRSCCCEFPWYTYETSCSKMISFAILGTPNQDYIPSCRPLDRAGTNHRPIWTPYDVAPRPDTSVSKNSSYVYDTGPLMRLSISVKNRHFSFLWLFVPD